MKKVCGLDLTGVARIGLVVTNSRGTRMLTDTIASRGARKDGLRARHSRLTDLGREVLHHAAVCDLVAILDVGTGPLDRAAAWWWVVGGLIRREVPVAVITPTALKVALAGEIVTMYPDVDRGCEDAAGLAHLGAVWLGMDVPTLERHKQVKAEWPT